MTSQPEPDRFPEEPERWTGLDANPSPRDHRAVEGVPEHRDDELLVILSRSVWMYALAGKVPSVELAEQLMEAALYVNNWMDAWHEQHGEPWADGT